MYSRAMNISSCSPKIHGYFLGTRYSLGKVSAIGYCSMKELYEYMFAKEIMPSLANIFTLYALLLELQYCKMNGWMICDFTSFSTVFQSYQDDGG